MVKKVSGALRANRLTALIAVCFLVSAALAAMASAASSSWTADYMGWQVDTTSNYSSGAGSQTVHGTVKASCTSHNAKVRIVRVRSLYPDEFQAYKTFTRNTYTSKTWSGLTNGTFHLNAACTNSVCDFHWTCTNGTISHN